MTKYIAKWDEDTESVIVIFGTDEEILEDCLQGNEGEFEDEYELGIISEQLEDAGSLCEGYLIDSKYKNKNDVVTVEGIVEQFDCFKKDVRLLDCGWG